MADDHQTSDLPPVIHGEGSLPQDMSPKRLSSKAKGILVLLSLCALAAGIAWLVWHQLYGKYLESTNNAYIEADIVTIAPRISGYVDQIYVRDNEEVKAGQPLVHINVQDYSAKARQAAAQIEVAKASAANARASIAEQEAAVEQSHAQVTAADSDARAARNEVLRYEPLVRTGAETQEKLTSLRTKAAKYDATARAARATWIQNQRHVATLQTQIQQAEAQEKGAQAELDADTVSVDAAIVRAGITGRVGDRSVRLGQYVQPGTRLLSIVPLDRLYVTANFKETQVGRMATGQPVSLSVDALPDVTLHGTVESLSPATGALFSLLPPQNATGNFTKVVQRVPVRILLTVPSDLRGKLVAGLSVVAEVDTKDTERLEHPRNPSVEAASP
ncbi:multidrug resistance efflux pump HlyD [Gluconobacter thailandicus F149-1 = NBRC 100600]|uniref:Multidrug resistance efflux pump n=1 Tax=Gluconobacter thailandicus NBRC 3257 TaxID=1381097 RepID=A0ABQ0IT19_GLUTH|nr:efflux RND transporter periplasmic adaptor subunit [Gluconobacter thailandicus]KXV54860.1 multidrug ABC transporter permease [Gluconobacter thailandicus]GAD25305.1 multidrug resistance efflux pump [Gluconobacter thailandicus NBRC 3257]GAN93016.1 multidrug resistance efflux pump HlyD [Gluconobacter thailandicus F149-1 = NBRC 100600]GEL88591.1 transporter [Gluconobacter thailandicus F149-1 = NBRC 100600]